MFGVYFDFFPADNVTVLQKVDIFAFYSLEYAYILKLNDSTVIMDSYCYQFVLQN